jgi:hypothetical protein
MFPLSLFFLLLGHQSVLSRDFFSAFYHHKVVFLLLFSLGFTVFEVLLLDEFSLQAFFFVSLDVFSLKVFKLVLDVFHVLLAFDVVLSHFNLLFFIEVTHLLFLDISPS